MRKELSQEAGFSIKELTHGGSYIRTESKLRVYRTQH